MAQRPLYYGCRARDAFVPEKIKVIYAAPPEEFAPVSNVRQLAKIRKRYGLPEKYLLYVGNMFGSNKLNVYGFGDWVGDDLP